jgi:hypothetical protein
MNLHTVYFLLGLADKPTCISMAYLHQYALRYFITKVPTYTFVFNFSFTYVVFEHSNEFPAKFMKTSQFSGMLPWHLFTTGELVLQLLSMT